MDKKRELSERSDQGWYSWKFFPISDVIQPINKFSKNNLPPWQEEEEQPRAVRARAAAAVKAAGEAGDQITDEQVFLDVPVGPGWSKLQ